MSSNAIEAVVDEQRLKLAFRLSYEEPSIQTSLGIITRYLFADGIEVMRGNEPIETKNDFNTYLLRNFRKMGEDGVRWIMCAGVVPLSFVQVGDTYIPVVERPGTGQIVSVYENHRQTFKYVSYNAFGAKDPSQGVVVIGGFGYDPTYDGRLTSLVNCLSHKQTLQAVLMDCAATAEAIRANPTFVLQTRKDNSQTNTLAALDYGVIAEYDGLNAGAQQRYYKDQSFRDAIKALDDDTPMISRIPLDPNGNLAPAAPWKGNMVNVPTNMELVHQRLPEVRGDLITVMRFTNSEVYNTLGVPEVMATGATTTKGSNADTITDMFKMTILWWKRMIGELMSIVYTYMYGREDAEYFVKSARRFKKNITEDLLYDMHRGSEIHINLPIPPFLTTQELILFYQNGAITEDEYINHLRHMANLPPATTNELHAETKRPRKENEKDKILAK